MRASVRHRGAHSLCPDPIAESATLSSHDAVPFLALSWLHRALAGAPCRRPFGRCAAPGRAPAVGLARLVCRLVRWRAAPDAGLARAPEVRAGVRASSAPRRARRWRRACGTTRRRPRVSSSRSASPPRTRALRRSRRPTWRTAYAPRRLSRKRAQLHHRRADSVLGQRATDARWKSAQIATRPGCSRLVRCPHLLGAARCRRRGPGRTETAGSPTAPLSEDRQRNARWRPSCYQPIRCTASSYVRAGTAGRLPCAAQPRPS